MSVPSQMEYMGFVEDLSLFLVEKSRKKNCPRTADKIGRIMLASKKFPTNLVRLPVS
jgi:hypothetical protein